MLRIPFYILFYLFYSADVFVELVEKITKTHNKPNLLLKLFFEIYTLHILYYILHIAVESTLLIINIWLGLLARYLRKILSNFYKQEVEVICRTAYDLNNIILAMFINRNIKPRLLFCIIKQNYIETIIGTPIHFYFAYFVVN